MPTGFYYGWWNISMEKNKLKLSRFQIMSVWPKNRRCLQVQNLTIYSTLHASPNDSLKIVHILMAFLNIYSIISQKREYHGTGFSAPHVWCLLQPGTPPITLFRYWHGITNWWHRVVLKNIDFQAIQLSCDTCHSDWWKRPFCLGLFDLWWGLREGNLWWQETAFFLPSALAASLSSPLRTGFLLCLGLDCDHNWLKAEHGT